MKFCEISSSSEILLSIYLFCIYEMHKINSDGCAHPSSNSYPIFYAFPKQNLYPKQHPLLTDSERFKGFPKKLFTSPWWIWEPFSRPRASPGGGGGRCLVQRQGPQIPHPGIFILFGRAARAPGGSRLQVRPNFLHPFKQIKSRLSERNLKP